MGHLLKLKSALRVHILASTSVPFKLTPVQIPNLTLIATKRITVHQETKIHINGHRRWHNKALVSWQGWTDWPACCTERRSRVFYCRECGEVFPCKQQHTEHIRFESWSRIHERTISLRFLGIILRVLGLEVFDIQCLHYKLVSKHFCSRVGEGFQEFGLSILYCRRLGVWWERGLLSE
jgi:hypothetical protein